MGVQNTFRTEGRVDFSLRNGERDIKVIDRSNRGGIFASAELALMGKIDNANGNPNVGVRVFASSDPKTVSGKDLEEGYLECGQLTYWISQAQNVSANPVAKINLPAGFAGDLNNASNHRNFNAVTPVAQILSFPFLIVEITGGLTGTLDANGNEESLDVPATPDAYVGTSYTAEAAAYTAARTAIKAVIATAAAATGATAQSVRDAAIMAAQARVAEDNFSFEDDMRYTAFSYYEGTKTARALSATAAAEKTALDTVIDASTPQLFVKGRYALTIALGWLTRRPDMPPNENPIPKKNITTNPAPTVQNADSTGGAGIPKGVEKNEGGLIKKAYMHLPSDTAMKTEKADADEAEAVASATAESRRSATPAGKQEANPVGAQGRFAQEKGQGRDEGVGDGVMPAAKYPKAGKKFGKFNAKRIYKPAGKFNCQAHIQVAQAQRHGRDEGIWERTLMGESD